MTLRLGKLPARPDAVSFKFANYANISELPKPPRYFGHEAISQSWQMLGNDRAGDCVWASAAHETMVWNAEAGRAVEFSDQSVLSDYSAVTGYNPNDPNSDQGTDMKDAASYRRKTGVLDASGQRHTIAAYLALAPGNVTQLYQALYLFGTVNIGIQFPSSAMSQFNAGKTWSVVRNSPIEGGHCICAVAKRSHIEVVTWGRIQPLTTGFYTHYADEALAMVSLESLTAGKSPEGFDYATLQADLAKLN